MPESWTLTAEEVAAVASVTPPAWFGVLYAALAGCDPIVACRDLQMVDSVAGPTPTAITASLARGVLFRPPADITVNRVRLLGVGITSGIYQFAIYPKAAGSNRMWTSGVVTTAAGIWLSISSGLPVTFTKNAEYWFCVSANTTGTVAGFRSPPAPIRSEFWGASAAPLGARSLGLAEYMQFAVTAGAFPATLPTIAAAAYGAGATGTVPLAFLDSLAA